MIKKKLINILFSFFIIGYTGQAVSCDYKDDIRKLAIFKNTHVETWAKKAKEFKEEGDRIRENNIYEENKDYLKKLAENQKGRAEKMLRVLNIIQICNKDFLRIKKKMEERFILSVEMNRFYMDMFSSEKFNPEHVKELNDLGRRAHLLQDELDKLYREVGSKYPY